MWRGLTFSRARQHSPNPGVGPCVSVQQAIYLINRYLHHLHFHQPSQDMFLIFLYISLMATGMHMKGTVQSKHAILRFSYKYRQGIVGSPKTFVPKEIPASNHPFQFIQDLTEI